MAPRGRTPVFLERGNYRQRRVIDAVRLLAVLGAVLWMIPLLWPTGDAADGAGMPMSRALSYVFAVWFFLICTGAFLVSRMRRARQEGSEPAGSEDA